MLNSLRLPSASGNVNVFLGIDLSSTSWHVTARCQQETILSASFPPRVEGLSSLLQRLSKGRVHSVYEAAGFGYGLHDWLTSQGVDSIVVSPAQIPVEVGNHVKTDRRDSLKLATTLEAGLLRPIFIPDPHQRCARELVRQRERIKRHRQASMVRLRALFLLYGVKEPAVSLWKGPYRLWLKTLRLEDPLLQETLEAARTLYFDLQTQIKALEARLQELARSREYAAWTALFTTVPGIGELTALTLAVEIVDWNRFANGEAFSSFVGLTPSEYSSGNMVHHGRITRAGNSMVRNRLVESSWTLIKKDPTMRAFYERIRRRRGGKKAIVGVARKLCHRLLAMAKSGEVYRVN